MAPRAYHRLGCRICPLNSHFQLVGKPATSPPAEIVASAEALRHAEQHERQIDDRNLLRRMVIDDG